MQHSSSVRYSYQDLQSLPEGHRRHEIVDGALFVTPLPRFDHQLVARNLTVLLHAWTQQHGSGVVVGPITVHLRDDLVLEPDVVFIARDRLHIADPDGDIHGPPDLVVEILSPSTRSYDRKLKRKRYLDSGVGELWIVDVDAREVEVWRPGAAKPRIVRDTLLWDGGGVPCELPLVEVFRGVGPSRM